MVRWLYVGNTPASETNLHPSADFRRAHHSAPESFSRSLYSILASEIPSQATARGVLRFDGVVTCLIGFMQSRFWELYR
jgi:hypothetical protein